MSERLILEKLDGITVAIATLDKNVALNYQAHNNLNAELQEYKAEGKWKAKCNIAIVGVMFAALGCWISLKGLDTGDHTPPTAIIKELGAHGKDNDN